MSTTDKPTDTPTNPADLLPAQIADALKMLAEKDGIYVAARANKYGHIDWHIIETRLKGGSETRHETRDASAPTYAEALAACRAAEFGGSAK